jgi:wyosine [tRNA(Phe)-imidazoG37] synthetase (radical SAM superfamily)
MKSIFGPVPSRRLGRSLGIDVVPPKTCSYDCIYCESGATTHLTIKRQCHITPDQVIHDLENYFREYPDGADVLTFSGAGEPTLYEPLGELIGSIKHRFPFIPLIVLTNGSLLWDPSVRRCLMGADRVVPSLDAATYGCFSKVNRPHPGLELSAILEGMQAFRREYRGRFHLEVVMVLGWNDSAEELAHLRQAADLIQPDRIELNTVVRPPAYRGVRGLSREQMNVASSFFPADRTEIIGEFHGSHSFTRDRALHHRIMDLISRRPCTVPEMAASLAVSVEELRGTISRLQAEEKLSCYLFDGKEYIRSCSDAAVDRSQFCK